MTFLQETELKPEVTNGTEDIQAVASLVIKVTWGNKLEDLFLLSLLWWPVGMNLIFFSFKALFIGIVELEE